MVKLNTELFQSFLYPSWWAGVNGLEVETTDGSLIQSNRADIEFLPQGLAVRAGSGIVHVIPWSNLIAIRSSGPIAAAMESDS